MSGVPSPLMKVKIKVYPSSLTETADPSEVGKYSEWLSLMEIKLKGVENLAKIAIRIQSANMPIFS